MISEKEAIEIHSILIERFGGSTGVRDKELLNSALNRPYQTFEGNELYPTPIDKAAAILESIVKNHPSVYGNKNTFQTHPSTLNQPSPFKNLYTIRPKKPSNPLL